MPTPEAAPIQKQAIPDSQEIGSSGLHISNGLVEDEILPRLRGDQGRRVFREMSDNDGMVGSILFSIEMMAREAEWSVEPAEGDDETGEGSPSWLIETALHDMSQTFDDTLSDILTMLPFGWAFHEVVLKRRQGYHDPESDVPSSQYEDNLVSWRKIPIRDQMTLDRWEIDENGGIRGMHQLAPPSYNSVFIPIERALLFRPKSNRQNPEGKSVLRTAYRDYFYKTRIQEIEAIGIERDLAGLPVAWVPPEMLDVNASAAEKAALAEMKNIVTNIRQDEQAAVVWPLSHDENGNKQYDITLLSTGGQRQFDTDTIITRYDKRIAMNVLADFVLIGHDKVGTQALSVSKIDLFQTAMHAWLEGIAQVFNRHAIPRLMRVNGIHPARSPRLVPGEVGRLDVERFVQSISEMANIGMPMFPDAEFESWIRRKLGWPMTKSLMMDLDAQPESRSNEPDDQDQDVDIEPDDQDPVT